MDKNTLSLATDVIINCFMNNPDLYNKCDPGYIDKYEKANKLEQIAEYLRGMQINIGVSDIIKIWQKLVNQFKECLSKEKSCKTGSAASENTFEYYEQMLFLKECLEHPTPLSSMLQVDCQTSTKRKVDERATAAVPEFDKFAKKKVKLLQQEENDFSQVSQEMLKTLQVMQNKINNQQAASSTVNYENIIKQAFKRVPAGYEDACLMKVLDDLEEFDLQHPSQD